MSMGRSCRPGGRANPIAERAVEDSVRRPHPAVAGLVTGLALMLPVALHSALATATADADVPTIDVRSNPPLLVTAGEPFELRFSVICADPAQPGSPDCAPAGELHVRPTGAVDWTTIPLIEGGPNRDNRLYAVVPSSLLTSGITSYYAVLRDASTNATKTIPAGGATAPQQIITLPASATVNVALPDRYGQPGTIRPFDRVEARSDYSACGGVPADPTCVEATAPEGGNVDDSVTTGVAAIDVDAAGKVYVLDTAGRAVLSPGAVPRKVPVDVRSSTPDLAVDATTGAYYVLESSPVPDQSDTPLLKAFDGATGALLRSVPTAEGIATSLHNSPAGPVVHQFPSDMWSPVFGTAGLPLPAEQQAALETVGRTTANGQIALKVTDDSVRVALLAGGAVVSAWNITDPSKVFGAVALAELDGPDLVLVVEQWDDSSALYRVLRISGAVVTKDFYVQPQEQVEAAVGARWRYNAALDRVYYLATSPGDGFTTGPSMTVGSWQL